MSTEHSRPVAIHSLQVVHAHQEGDLTGCNSRGTKRVTLNSWEVTCRRCERWDTANTTYTLSPKAAEYVRQLDAERLSHD